MPTRLSSMWPRATSDAMSRRGSPTGRQTEAAPAQQTPRRTASGRRVTRRTAHVTRQRPAGGAIAGCTTSDTRTGGWTSASGQLTHAGGGGGGALGGSAGRGAGFGRTDGAAGGRSSPSGRSRLGGGRRLRVEASGGRDGWRGSERESRRGSNGGGAAVRAAVARQDEARMARAAACGAQ